MPSYDNPLIWQIIAAALGALSSLILGIKQSKAHIFIASIFLAISIGGSIYLAVLVNNSQHESEVRSSNDRKRSENRHAEIILGINSSIAKINSTINVQKATIHSLEEELWLTNKLLKYQNITLHEVRNQWNSFSNIKTIYKIRGHLEKADYIVIKTLYSRGLLFSQNDYIQQADYKSGYLHFNNKSELSTRPFIFVLANNQIAIALYSENANKKLGQPSIIQLSNRHEDINSLCKDSKYEINMNNETYVITRTCDDLKANYDPTLNDNISNYRGDVIDIRASTPPYHSEPACIELQFTKESQSNFNQSIVVRGFSPIKSKVLFGGEVYSHKIIANEISPKYYMSCQDDMAE